MSFADELADNTKQAMVSALLRTVVSDPNRTIGEIQTALENEVKAPYMPALFKDVTVGQLVQATAIRIREMGTKPVGEGSSVPQPSSAAPPPGAQASGGKRDDSEEEDDEEEREEGEQEKERPKKKPKSKKSGRKKSPPTAKQLQEESGPEDDLEDEEEPKKKKKKGKGKKDKNKGSKGSSDGEERLSLVDPNDQKAYQSAIVKLLRKSKCESFESGMSSTEIRKELGGSPKQFRDNIDACVIAERVHKDGQARGVRYFIGK